MDSSVVVFQRSPQKGDKSAQRKVLGIHPPSTAPGYLCELPAQHEPHVQQQKAHPISTKRYAALRDVVHPRTCPAHR
jgi:hypothetical protein